MSRRLDSEEIQRQLMDLPGWDFVGGGDDHGPPTADCLRRSIEFPTFLAGIACVGDVAADAEAMNHHPDIDIRWRTVTFTLSTHSEGGLTQLDIELAHQIDVAAARALN